MGVSLAADVMKPGFERVRTHSKPGFMPSRRTRGAQVAVRTVPVLPESGSPGSRTRQRLQAKRHRAITGTMPHRPGYHPVPLSSQSLPGAGAR